MTTDTPPRLADELRELANLDTEIDLLGESIAELKAERETLLERRQALNVRLSHYFRMLPPLSIIRGDRDVPFIWHMGRVVAAPAYSAATAQAIHRGDFPAPAAATIADPNDPPPPAGHPRGPFGFPLPFPAADTPEAAEFGPAGVESAAAVDPERP